MATEEGPKDLSEEDQRQIDEMGEQMLSTDSWAALVPIVVIAKTDPKSGETVVGTYDNPGYTGVVSEDAHGNEK